MMMYIVYSYRVSQASRIFPRAHVRYGWAHRSTCTMSCEAISSHNHSAHSIPPLRYKSDVGGLIKDCFPSNHAPACLKEYMSYVHSLSYTAAPDYRRMQQMFIKELGRCGLKDDGKGLDWIATGKKVSVRTCTCIWSIWSL